MPIVHARTAEAIEEERRLLYVAVTRARVHLTLSWASARTPGPGTPGAGGVGFGDAGHRGVTAALALPRRDAGARPGGPPMSDALDKLLDLLDLEQIEVRHLPRPVAGRAGPAGVRRPGGRPGAGRRRADGA